MEYLPGELDMSPVEEQRLIFWSKFPASSNTTRMECRFTADTVQIIFFTTRHDIVGCRNNLLFIFNRMGRWCNYKTKCSLEFQFFSWVKCGWVIDFGFCVWYTMSLCFYACSVNVYTGMDVHKRVQVKVKWKLKNMWAAVRIWEYVSGKWHSTRHVCRFDQLSLSLFGEAGTIFYTSFPLTINISLPLPPTHHSFPFLPTLLLLFLIQPILFCPSSSMDEWWYSRGIVEEESFPGPVASSSQIKQGTCSDHLTVSLLKLSDRNTFLQACPSCAHISSFHCALTLIYCLSSYIIHFYFIYDTFIGLFLCLSACFQDNICIK